MSYSSIALGWKMDRNRINHQIQCFGGAQYWIPAFTLHFLCFLNISFLSVCLWSITLLFISFFMLTLPFIFCLTHILFFTPSLSLASLWSAVLSVGMLFAGCFFHIRISTRSRSGRGIFCPLLSCARPSRPLACLDGDSAHKHRVQNYFLSLFFIDTIMLALFH